jgi:hypothetical protein
MKRIDIVTLLKDITTSCKSSPKLEGAVITEHKNEDGWMLSITWIPDSFDKECLNQIALKHNLKVISTEGHVVFRSLPTEK